MAGTDISERKENKRNESRRNSKPIVFPQSYYTINRTTTTTTTLELNYHRRNSNTIMSSPGTQRSEGVTALMLACLQNRINDVQSILKKNKDSYKTKTKSGKVPLHFCAEGGSLRCLEVILAADPTLINTRDEEGYTPIHLAVINGNKEVVKALISAHADLNCVDNEKHSLVHWATVCGELEILDILLSSGAPASTPDIHMAHPIHYASQMCGNVKNSESRTRVQSTVYGVSPKKGLVILRRLLQHGVSPDVKDKDGRQPLLWAASAGSADAILSLVNSGASVQAEDKDGLTALHCAASRGHTDCLETLIALCGAEVDVIDNNGCTALFYAVTLGHADCTELLLNFGAEPNRQDRKGRTPAHCGAAKGQLETIKLLGKHGGNLWMKNVRGDLPLHEAVISRRKDLVLWLLSQRPDTVNAQNNDGRCPIHLAALNNNVEMVKILVDHHSEVNPLMRTGKGIAMTPLDAAIHKGNSAVAKFLQLHGGLPANSLNDSALHRRMNRTLESQARSVSSLRGSQLGNHHESSPDRDLHNRFTSPEFVDKSGVHQYADSMVTTILKQTSVMTSTPIMDDSAQTDGSHYQRDMQVQTSIGLELDVETSTENGTVVRHHHERRSESKSSEKKSTTRKKRVSVSREKSPANGNESTDSEEKHSGVSAARSSTKSSRKHRSVRNKTPASRTSSMPQELHNTENREIHEDILPPKYQDQVASSSSKFHSAKNTHQELRVPSAELLGNFSDLKIKSTAEEAEIEAKDDTHHSYTHGSSYYNNESEHFSELENVAVQSSESEVMNEELGPVETDSTILYQQHAAPESVLPVSQLLENNQLITEINQESVSENITEQGQKSTSNKIRKHEAQDIPDGDEVDAVSQQKHHQQIHSKTNEEKGDNLHPTQSTSSSSGTLETTSSSRDSHNSDIDNKTGHVKNKTQISTVEEEESRELAASNASTTQPTTEATTSSSISIESPKISKDVVENAISNQERHKYIEEISHHANESKDTCGSATSKESRDQGTETRSDDTDGLIRLTEIGGISLQEAYARRRRSRSKHSLSPSKSTKNDKSGESKSDNSARSKQSASSGGPGVPLHKSEDDTIGQGDSARSTARLSVREQFKQNREMLEQKSALLAKSSTRGGRGKATSEEREILLQEELLKSGSGHSPGKPQLPTTRHQKAQSKLSKSNVKNHDKSKVVTVNRLEVGRQRDRNIPEYKASTPSEDTPHSWIRDSGYSDQIHHTTSASEDQNKNLTSKSTGSLRRKVVARRPGSSSIATGNKRYGASAKKKSIDSRNMKDKRKIEGIELQHLQRPGLPHLEKNGSGGSTSHGGSITSEDGTRTKKSISQAKDFKWRGSRPRSKLTFTKGEDLNALMSPYQKKNMDVDTPISVTQAMQQSMRKYQLERKIFQELLELKRLQIRAGKANEQVLVKRLADTYRKAGLSINYREFDGAYTFRNFEKYLYDQLRLLQANRKLLPRFAPSDDLGKLSTALKKMNATKLPFLDDDDERPVTNCLDESQCTHLTHRCHHASHAYIGVPCAAYINKSRRTPFLPKVDPLRAPGPTNFSRMPANGKRSVQMIISPREDAASPITVEVQQGSSSQVFSLPNNSLDPTKNYYVSLSIKPTPTPPPSVMQELSSLELKSTSSMSNNVNRVPDESGSLSAPPPIVGEQKR